jgi:hypothetical protein
MSIVASDAPLLRYTDESTYIDVNDAGSTIANIVAVVETPWLAMAGIQGFQRAYRMELLFQDLNGSEGAPMFGNLVTYRDFDDSVETENASFTYITNPDFTTKSRGQIQHHFAQQKCESIKLKLSFYSEGATRFRLTALSLQVGVKPGMFRMSSSSRI